MAVLVLPLALGASFGAPALAGALPMSGTDGFRFGGHQLPGADQGAVRTITYAGRKLRYVAPRGSRALAAADGPSCTVAAIYRAGQGGYDQDFDEEIVIVEAPAGLAKIDDIVVDNGAVADPELSVGTLLPVVVVAVKRDQAKLTTWSFDATDVDGHTTPCV